MRERREEEGLARKERDRRRRRVLVEQMRTHKDMEGRRRGQLLGEKIARQSAEEQRIAARLHVALEEKEVMRLARIRREAQYLQQRQAQYEEVLAADAKKYAIAREDYQVKTQRNGDTPMCGFQPLALRLLRSHRVVSAGRCQLSELCFDPCRVPLVHQAALVASRTKLEESDRMRQAAVSQKHYDACRGIADQVHVFTLCCHAVLVRRVQRHSRPDA